MAKTSVPLFSFKAQGTIGNAITFQDRNRGTMVREKPTPRDPRTLAQVYHRWLFEDAIWYWRSLTTAQKQAYAPTARRLHMTTYAYVIGLYLRTLPDLCGLWHMDERSENKTPDSSIHSNHASILGAKLVPGWVDKNFSLDGNDDYLSPGSSSDLNPENAITLLARVRFHEFKNYSAVFSKYYYHPYCLYVQANGKIGTRLYFDTGLTIYFWSTAVLTLNERHQVGITWSAETGQIILHVDNSHKTVGSGYTNRKLVYPTPYSLMLGKRLSVYMHGEIDEAEVRSRAFSNDQLDSRLERRYP